MELATIIVLALLVGLLIFRMERQNAAMERRSDRASEDARRGIDLCHASLRNNPNTELTKLIAEHLGKYHLLTDRAMEAAMSISDEYRRLVVMRTERDLAATMALNAHERLLNTPYGRGAPGMNGKAAPVRDEVVEEQAG